MVTNPVENGMVKCHEYWPSRAMAQYGTMVVTLVGEKLFPEFIMRTFTLTMTAKNKKVNDNFVQKSLRLIRGRWVSLMHVRLEVRVQMQSCDNYVNIYIAVIVMVIKAQCFRPSLILYFGEH